MTIEILCSVELSMKKVLIVGIFIFMTKWNFMLSWGEHEKSFITLGPASSVQIQSNLSSSNPDGLFTMADSNLFLSPYKILPISPENKYLKKFSYFIMKLYVVCTH